MFSRYMYTFYQILKGLNMPLMKNKHPIQALKSLIKSMHIYPPARSTHIRRHQLSVSLNFSENQIKSGSSSQSTSASCDCLILLPSLVPPAGLPFFGFPLLNFQFFIFFTKLKMVRKMELHNHPHLYAISSRTGIIFTNVDLSSLR